MSLRKTFKTNKALETNGVTIPVGINEYNNRPTTITIARMTRSNKKYAAKLDEATRPHTAAIQNETLDETLASKMMQEVFADTILLGWDNVPKSDLTGRDEDNEIELDFNRANVLALFEELPDLYTDWETRAKRAASFREVEQVAAAGN